MEIKSLEDLRKSNPELAESINKEFSANAIADFKKSDGYIALQKKADAVSESETEMNVQVNEKLKAELGKTKEELKALDKKIFVMQMSSNKHKSDKILADMVADADYSEKIQNKILASKPDFEKHLNDEGSLKADSYAEACKKEVESWAGILEEVDQTTGLEGEKEVALAPSEVSAYSESDKDKF